MSDVTIKIKRSLTPGNNPGLLALGELAINIPDKRIYIGDNSTDGNALIIDGLASGGGTIYTAGSGINITGTVIRLDPAIFTTSTNTLNILANTVNFTGGSPSLTGVSSITSQGGNLYITGNLIVSGYIETDTGIRGNTDVTEEYLGYGMVLDGGSY
jgi:hypothetical protein